MTESVNDINRKVAMDRMEAAGALPDRVKKERAIKNGTYCEFMGPSAGTVHTSCRGVNAESFKCSHETVNKRFCSCIASVPRKNATEIVLLDGTKTELKGDIEEYVAVCDQCEYRKPWNGRPIQPVHGKPTEEPPVLPRPADGRSLRDEVNQFVLDSTPREMTVGEADKLAIALERFVKRIVSRER